MPYKERAFCVLCVPGASEGVLVGPGASVISLPHRFSCPSQEAFLVSLSSIASGTVLTELLCSLPQPSSSTLISTPIQLLGTCYRNSD